MIVAAGVLALSVAAAAQTGKPLAFDVAIEIAEPAWLRDVRVDVHAIPPAGSTQAQIPAMLQTLLAERFGLVAHTETRLGGGQKFVICDL